MGTAVRNAVMSNYCDALVGRRCASNHVIISTLPYILSTPSLCVVADISV
jgi:hypothetical protein